MFHHFSWHLFSTSFSIAIYTLALSIILITQHINKKICSYFHLVSLKSSITFYMALSLKMVQSQWISLHWNYKVLCSLIICTKVLLSNDDLALISSCLSLPMTMEKMITSHGMSVNTKTNCFINSNLFYHLWNSLCLA